MIDWEAVREEYVTTGATYAALAEKYGTIENTVYKHAKKGNWRDERERFRRETGEDALKSARVRSARARARELEALLKSEELLEEHISCALSGQLRPGQILQISIALENAVRTKRNLLGLPTQAEGHAQRIAGAKLNLEKKKAEAAEHGVSAVQVEFVVPPEATPEQREAIEAATGAGE